MYNILNLYEEDCDPKKPLVCLDEKPKQLLEDKRKSIPMKPGLLRNLIKTSGLAVEEIEAFLK
ncbi:Mobile element protein [Methanosarcina sp. WH1]|nr:Mobile element protein [Methanosarcina sp. WH1]